MIQSICIGGSSISHSVDILTVVDAVVDAVVAAVVVVAADVVVVVVAVVVLLVVVVVVTGTGVKQSQLLV